MHARLVFVTRQELSNKPLLDVSHLGGAVNKVHTVKETYQLAQQVAKGVKEAAPQHAACRNTPG
jgi:hypothetical protein